MKEGISARRYFPRVRSCARKFSKRRESERERDAYPRTKSVFSVEEFDPKVAPCPCRAIRISSRKGFSARVLISNPSTPFLPHLNNFSATYVAASIKRKEFKVATYSRNKSERAPFSRNERKRVCKSWRLRKKRAKRCENKAIMDNEDTTQECRCIYFFLNKRGCT